MRIRRVPSKGLIINNLPVSHLRLLQQIPLHADPAGSPAAEKRLYPSPVRTPLDDVEDELVADWTDHVMPDLRTEFTRQLDCLAADLGTARLEPPPRDPDASAVREIDPADPADQDDQDAPDSETLPAAAETYELIIPREHVDLWYGALNQARLAMQARYDFPEIASLDAIVSLLASENLKPYLTAQFYAEIQGALLDLGMAGAEEA